MALTLKAPPPVERQLTESKWDAAEETLRQHPECSQHTVLLTPTHVYTLERTPDGTFMRIRAKSREETNVDVDPSPRASGGPGVLVRSAS